MFPYSNNDIAAASRGALQKFKSIWNEMINLIFCKSENSWQDRNILGSLYPSRALPQFRFRSSCPNIERKKSVFSLAFIRLMSDSNINQINRSSQVLWLLCRSVYWSVYWKHTRESRQAEKSWRSRWEQKITGFTRPLDGSVCPTVWRRTWINTRSNEGMRSRCGMRKAIRAEPFQVEEAEPETTAESVKRKEHLSGQEWQPKPQLDR